jgi:hypothetical protein
MLRRIWRLAAAALGLALVVANPASMWAHALGHHDGGQQAGRHLSSLESHHGPAEASAPGHSDDHPHARLDQAPRTPEFQLEFGPAVSPPNAALVLAGPARSASPSATLRPPAPPGRDPTRVRAPPLR